MIRSHQLKTYPNFRWIDHTNISHEQKQTYTAIDSFAIDDALTHCIGDYLSPPSIRLWMHHKTVVLGVPDTRLPFIKEGIEHLFQAGYHVIVRNSGGLAVVLDDGILNVSIILPEAQKVSIQAGYEIMYKLVEHMFADVTNDIKAFEIIGSYCPGDYDLSINGIKFAGISQRRVKKGVAIQIYLDITGESQKRARLIKAFYDKGIKGALTTFTYPAVEENKMGSLRQLLGAEFTMEEISTRIRHAVKNLFSCTITSSSLTSEEAKIYQKRYQLMRKRNEEISSLIESLAP